MELNFSCPTCAKESYNRVPLMRVLEKLDTFFSSNDLDGATRLLEYWENEARNLHDDRVLLELLNEEIGLFRRTADKERALAAVNEAFELVDRLELCDECSSGTVYLNGATTMKAFGMAKEALSYYEKAKQLYEKHLTADDYRLAAYHNNISSAYRELGYFDKAEHACLSALKILESCGGYLGEMAVTHVNLSHIYYDADPCDERIYEHMETAWELLMTGSLAHDANYAFIASKCYHSFAFFGYFEYEKKLKELSEKIYAGT